LFTHIPLGFNGVLALKQGLFPVLTCLFGNVLAILAFAGGFAFFSLGKADTVLFLAVRLGAETSFVLRFAFLAV
jgi:hypothetical protein